MADPASSSPPVESPPDIAELPSACARGDSEAVARLLAAGVPVHLRLAEQDATVLHLAARRPCNVPVLLALLAGGAELEARDIDENTPLMLAAGSGGVENTAFLLDSGAMIDAVNGEHDTPLACACRLKQHEAVKLLIARGADVGRSDRHLVSPLHWAVGRGDNERIRTLIELGAPVDQDPVGCAPLVSWITRPGLSAASVEMILSRSSRFEEYLPVLAAVINRAKRPELMKIVEKVKAARGK